MLPCVVQMAVLCVSSPGFRPQPDYRCRLRAAATGLTANPENSLASSHKSTQVHVVARNFVAPNFKILSRKMAGLNWSDLKFDFFSFLIFFFGLVLGATYTETGLCKNYINKKASSKCSYSHEDN